MLLLHGSALDPGIRDRSDASPPSTETLTSHGSTGNREGLLMALPQTNPSLDTEPSIPGTACMLVVVTDFRSSRSVLCLEPQEKKGPRL